MSRPDNNKGFTLIEVVVALGIFSIMMVGILTVYSGVFQQLGNSRRQAVANYESQQELEKAASQVVTSTATDTAHSMTITFGEPGDERILDVPGKLYEHGEFTNFVPD
ncbi:MAG: hypothetical protein AVO33_01990 [delta proteobacterium ML8_F1]|nr:MAG: hypothetical protein AVO33_01990 [delta proteobacterium ML8_F1]